MGKEALVVPSEVLFKEKKFEGFLPVEKYDYLSIIKSSFHYEPRGEALESNDKLQQIIPYVWIVNPQTKQVFVYKRSANESYSEKRLQNKVGCGVGGHIDHEDKEDPIQNAMMRELKEEVSMTEYPQPKIVGYVNLNHDVHAVHFGVVALAETTQTVTKGDDEMVHCQFCTIKELDKMFADPSVQVEEWTLQSWPFIKNYLEN